MIDVYIVSQYLVPFYLMAVSLTSAILFSRMAWKLDSINRISNTLLTNGKFGNLVLKKIRTSNTEFIQRIRVVQVEPQTAYSIQFRDNDTDTSQKKNNF